MLPFRSSFGTPKTDSKFWAFISISKKKKKQQNQQLDFILLMAVIGEITQ